VAFLVTSLSSKLGGIFHQTLTGYTYFVMFLQHKSAKS